MRSLLSIFVASLLLCALPRSICAQIFVTNSGTGTVGEYSTSGEPLDLTLISGLISPQGIAVSGENLFVTSFAVPDRGEGRVGEYTISGVPVNRTLIALFGPSAIAVSGMNLFVGSDNISSESSNVGKYTTSGEPVNARLVPELTFVSSMAVFGDSLFVADVSLGRVSEYNTTTGALVNPALVSRLDFPSGLAVSGGYLFVSDYNTGTIGKYTLSGETVDANLISGLDRPTSIAVIPASVAEISSTWILLLLAVTAILSLKAWLPRPA